MPAAQNPIALSFADRTLERAYLDRYFEDVLLQSRIALGLGTTLYVLFAFLDRWIAPDQQAMLGIIRFGFAVPWLLVVLAISFTPWFRRFFQVWLSSVTVVAGIGISAMVWVTEGMVSAWFAIALILVIIWSFTFSGLRFFNAAMVCVPLILLIDGISLGVSHHALPVFINNNFYLISTLIISMFAGYTIERYSRQNFLNARAIEAERLANERLLLNILPAPIAQRLKQHPETIADRFDEITILFADLVGFTPLATQLSPIQLVELLNSVFSAFDALTDRYQLEKIKTIGDAYMVASGLPHPHPDPVGAIADLALAMQAEIERLAQVRNYPLSLRIGIHTGTVVAGVIGTKKFSYDIWSDAVNTASRMESYSLPGQIQITKETATRLQDRYDCTVRGVVDIKGKEPISTYWLVGRKTSSIFSQDSPM